MTKVLLPFLIALLGSRVYAWALKKGVESVSDGVTVMLFTVAVGMILRRFVFDRTIAPSFVIVTLMYMSVTMLGWREIAPRRSKN